MKIKLMNLLQNFSYVVGSNFISLTVSVIVTLIVPRYLGVEEYGYYQLYIFYLTYINYLSFGLPDGAYLRYGGEDYKSLNKPLFVSQFWMLLSFMILISIIVITFLINNLSLSIQRLDVVLFSCIAATLVVPRALIDSILQATNVFKKYSAIIISERIMYLILTLLFLFLKVDNFKYFILADIFGKLASIIYGIFLCKDLVIGKFATMSATFKEVSVNITVGIKLIGANLASVLIVGVVRFMIEIKWSIEVFAKVSLTLSISSMAMVFINSMGLVLFPVLRKYSEDKLRNIYPLVRNLIIPVLLGALIVYYPLEFILSMWLPQYAESLKFMILLLPIIIYDSKMSLLVNTYLKIFRKERILMIINFVTVIFSVILSIISVFIVSNVHLSILTILISSIFRSIISEMYISNLLKINLKRDTILELIMTFIFIAVTWYSSDIIAVSLYTIAYLAYLLFKKDSFLYTWQAVKPLISVKKN